MGETAETRVGKRGHTLIDLLHGKSGSRARRIRRVVERLEPVRDGRLGPGIVPEDVDDGCTLVSAIIRRILPSPSIAASVKPADNQYDALFRRATLNWEGTDRRGMKLQ